MGPTILGKQPTTRLVIVEVDPQEVLVGLTEAQEDQEEDIRADQVGAQEVTQGQAVTEVLVEVQEVQAAQAADLADHLTALTAVGAVEVATRTGRPMEDRTGMKGRQRSILEVHRWARRFRQWQMD